MEILHTHEENKEGERKDALEDSVSRYIKQKGLEILISRTKNANAKSITTIRGEE